MIAVVIHSMEASIARVTMHAAIQTLQDFNGVKDEVIVAVNLTYKSTLCEGTNETTSFT